jgi:hypothetical protein
MRIGMRFARLGVAVISLGVLAGCAGLDGYTTGGDSRSTPIMRWDQVDQGALWTQETLAALRSHGAPLLEVVPADIDRWCPDYADGDAETRAQFWTGLISSLSFHESTWDQRAVGGGGLWFGLVQIAPATARGYRCDVGSGEALKDGAANLRCGVRIMAHTVTRDGVVSQGMRGVAADWGPFHSTRKLEDMRAWVSSQSYCQAPKLGFLGLF